MVVVMSCVVLVLTLVSNLKSTSDVFDNRVLVTMVRLKGEVKKEGETFRDTQLIILKLY